jgi:cell division protein FtsQ
LLRTAARWSARLVVAGGVAYAVLLGVQEGYDYATTSPRFEVRGLTFTPTSHIDDARLRQLMAVAPGTNILSIDLDEIAGRIVADPWVARATVVRVLPDTLDVVVQEHEPAALLLADSFYLMDDQGQPFKPLDAGERGELPIVSGIDRVALIRQPDQAKARIRRALDVLAQYQSKRRPRLSEVNIDETGAVTLYTAELGSQLRLGRDAFDTALVRYDALRAALGEDSQKLAVAHLDVTTQVGRKDRVVASFYATQKAPAFITQAQERAEARSTAAQSADTETSKTTRPRRGGNHERSRIPRYE